MLCVYLDRVPIGIRQGVRAKPSQVSFPQNGGLEHGGLAVQATFPYPLQEPRHQIPKPPIQTTYSGIPDQGCWQKTTTLTPSARFLNGTPRLQRGCAIDCFANLLLTCATMSSKSRYLCLMPDLKQNKTAQTHKVKSNFESPWLQLRLGMPIIFAANNS